MRFSWIPVLMLGFLLTGITSPPPPLSPPHTTGICLPEGATPEFLLWPVVDAYTGAILEPSGTPVEVYVVTYRLGNRSVQVAWIRGEIALYDPDPGGDVPGLQSDRILTMDGKLKGTRNEGPCSWHRPPGERKTRGEST